MAFHGNRQDNHNFVGFLDKNTPMFLLGRHVLYPIRCNKALFMSTAGSIDCLGQVICISALLFPLSKRATATPDEGQPLVDFDPGRCPVLMGFITLEGEPSLLIGRVRQSRVLISFDWIHKCQAIEY